MGKFGVAIGGLSAEAGIGRLDEGCEIICKATAKQVATCGPASSVSELLETVDLSADYPEIVQTAMMYKAKWVMYKAAAVAAPHLAGAYFVYSLWNHINGTPVDPCAEVLKSSVLIAKYVEACIPIDLEKAFKFKGKLTVKKSWGAHAKVSWPSGYYDEEGFLMAGKAGGIEIGHCGSLGCFAGKHMDKLKFKAIVLFANVELEFTASYKEEAMLTPSAFKKRLAKNDLAKETDKLDSEILLSKQQQRKLREWMEEQAKQAKAEAKAERDAIIDERNGCRSNSKGAAAAATAKAAAERSRSKERSKPTKEEMQATRAEAKAEDASKRAKSKERSKSNRTKSVGRSSGKV